MTKQEFTERTGWEVSDKVYSFVEEIYMNAGSMDKDLFCQIFKSLDEPQFTLINHLMSSIHEYQGREEELKNVIEDLHSQKDKMDDFLVDEAEMYSSSNARDKAIEILGARDYIFRKLEKGYNLWDSDKELLKEELKFS